MGAFSREQVFEAAKFALKARPYDISVRSLDVADSPIYYKKKNKSHWYFNRKRLDKKAQVLIEKAKVRSEQSIENLSSGEYGEYQAELSGLENYESSKRAQMAYPNPNALCYTVTMNSASERLIRKLVPDARQLDHRNSYVRLG